MPSTEIQVESPGKPSHLRPLYFQQTMLKKLQLHALAIEFTEGERIICWQVNLGLLCDKRALPPSYIPIVTTTTPTPSLAVESLL